MLLRYAYACTMRFHVLGHCSVRKNRLIPSYPFMHPFLVRVKDSIYIHLWLASSPLCSKAFQTDFDFCQRGFRFEKFLHHLIIEGAAIHDAAYIGWYLKILYDNTVYTKREEERARFDSIYLFGEAVNFLWCGSWIGFIRSLSPHPPY